jgi:hypothetical protein
MSVKITPLALSLTLAAQPILAYKLHHSTLAEPPHTHQEPTIPRQTINVSSPAVSGANVASKTHSVDSHIAGSDLVLPLDALRAATDRGATNAEYFAHLKHGIPGVQQTANLCMVCSGDGTTYVYSISLDPPPCCTPR